MNRAPGPWTHKAAAKHHPVFFPQPAASLRLRPGRPRSRARCPPDSAPRHHPPPRRPLQPGRPAAFCCFCPAFVANYRSPPRVRVSWDGGGWVEKGVPRSPFPRLRPFLSSASRAPLAPLAPDLTPSFPGPLGRAPLPSFGHDPPPPQPTPPAAAPRTSALTPRPGRRGWRGARGPGTRGGPAERSLPPSPARRLLGAPAEQRGSDTSNSCCAGLGSAQLSGTRAEAGRVGKEKRGAEGAAACGQVQWGAPGAARAAAARSRHPEGAAGAARGPRWLPGSPPAPPRAPLCAPRPACTWCRRGGQLTGRALIGRRLAPPPRPPRAAACWAPSGARPTKAQRRGPRGPAALRRRRGRCFLSGGRQAAAGLGRQSTRPFLSERQTKKKPMRGGQPAQWGQILAQRRTWAQRRRNRQNSTRESPF